MSVGRIQCTEGHWTEAPSTLCHVGLSTGQLTVSEQANEKCQRIWTFVIFRQMSENKDFSLWVVFFPWLFAWLVISDWMSDNVHRCQLLSRVQLFVIPWTVACQATPSMGFPGQEYWSRLPFPSPGDLPNPRIKPRSPTPQANSTVWAKVLPYWLLDIFIL